MCDFSLEAVKSRAAVDGEDLVLKKFSGTSKGFVSPADTDCAVCCKSGMEMICNLTGEFNTTAMDKPHDTETEVFIGETAFVFHTLLSMPGWRLNPYKDGLITPRGRFLSLQDLPEGARAHVVKALPDELIEAVKGTVAFEPEDRVDLEAQRRSLRQAFRLSAD